MDSITLIMQDHDFLQPLLCGDVVAEGVDLKIVRGNLRIAQQDSSVPASELSFARHVKRISEDDHSWVAMPAFVRRGFSHRAWYVTRDSGLKSFKDLNGKRIGTNEWPATGNTWSRAAGREQGLDIFGIDWVVGSVDGGEFAHADALPAHVRYASSEEGLVDLLLRGELDALMCPDPPRGFYDDGSKVVRLLPDFRTAERDFYKRTGVFPAYHLAGLRKEVFDRKPSVLLSIYRALEQSRLAWSAMRLYENDTSPWLLADLEETMQLMGHEWQPYGEAENAKTVAFLCEDMLAQRLIDRAVDPSALFSEFRALSSAG